MVFFILKSKTRYNVGRSSSTYISICTMSHAIAVVGMYMCSIIVRYYVCSPYLLPPSLPPSYNRSRD